MQISQYNHKYIIQHYTTYTWIWIIWRKPYAKTLNTWRSTNGKFCVNESVISFGWFTVFSFGDQLITKCQAGRVKLASHWDLLFCCTLTSSTYNTAMNHKTEAFSLQLQKRMNAQAIMVFHFVEKQNKAQWMFLQEAARAPPHGDEHEYGGLIYTTLVKWGAGFVLHDWLIGFSSVISLLINI